MSRLTCPVITKRIYREQVLHWHCCEHVCAKDGANRSARTHAHTQCEAPNHTKSVREQKGENGCFPNYMPLAALPVRPVWKHEWAACKSIGTRDLVSSKSSADWHVLHVISCIVLRGERLSFSDWLVKGCFAVVHDCVKGGSICLSVNDAGSPSSSVRGWIMSNIIHHHPPSTHTRLSNKGLSLSSSPFKNHRIYDSGFRKSSSPILMPAKYPARIRRGLLMCALHGVEQCIVVRVINWGKRGVVQCA